MKRHVRILNILTKIAEGNEGVGNANLTAAIVYKSEIISIGYNQRRTDPFQARYGTTKHHIYLHAEIHAIKNALNHIDLSYLSKCSLYVCRIRKNSSWAMSQPCEGCRRAVAQFGIKQLVHTVDDGTFSINGECRCVTY